MIRLIIGVLGMALTYAYRPPAGLGDAFSMLLNGQSFYLKQPLFTIFMASFALLAGFGLLGMIQKGKGKS